jgi:hypothetical protein
MNFIAVKDLKKPRSVREMLRKEGELLLLNNGRPMAILLDVGEHADPQAMLDAVRDARSRQALCRIRRHAHWVTAAAETTAAGLPDPDDRPFLECARSADVAAVTGNRRHYPRAAAAKVRVMTPAEYVKRVEDAQGRDAT